MRTVKEIEKDIKQLPREDLAALRKWFADLDAEQWDRQLDDDVASGKLNKLADKAVKDSEVYRPVTSLAVSVRYRIRGRGRPLGFPVVEEAGEG